MEIIRTISEMQQRAEALRRSGKRIGFVPTMGYLHEGHLSLMRLARPRCDVLVVSIFVNPTQFGPNEDFQQYPRDLERDERLCRQEQVDILFYPSAEDMYPPPYRTYVTVQELSETLCGRSRPGHFRGVATVVCKLFNIVKPHLAVFGEKDFQQAQIIKQMVRDLNFDVEILTGPIIRESDGLALSSRNKYLSPEQRRQALALSRSLKLAEEMVQQGTRQAQHLIQAMSNLIQAEPEARIDYIAVVDPESLKPVNEVTGPVLVALAVFVGSTRLIDNRLIRPPA